MVECIEKPLLLHRMEQHVTFFLFIQQIVKIRAFQELKIKLQRFKMIYEMSYHYVVSSDIVSSI